jgi:hypothetical protein
MPPAFARLHSAIKTRLCFELRCTRAISRLFPRFLLQVRHVRGFVIRGAVRDGHVLPLLFPAILTVATVFLSLSPQQFFFRFHIAVMFFVFP